MKSIALVGIVLIVLGICGLVYGRIGYTTKDKVLDLGPIQATAETEHSVPIPEIAGIVAVIAGLVLVVTGAKRA